MFTKTTRRTKPGRPPGLTAEGRATRARLYEVAVAHIGRRGFERATLRAVAADAGVSPALLYKYFPSKRAVVLALYDDLSHTFAERAASLSPGPWRKRFEEAVQGSLATLTPHRLALRALIPLMLTDADDGVFATRTAFSRRRVHGVFEAAVLGATDRPKGDAGAALGRVVYFAHLGLVLWWLMDRSPGQRATRALLAALVAGLAPVALALRLPPMKAALRAVDRAIADAFGDLAADVSESART